MQARCLSLVLALITAIASAQASNKVDGEEHRAQPPATTADDPLFAEPYVDIDERRSTPVPHRYVHGGFKGTDTRFSFYFPPKDQYQGRFFQHITPVPDSENLAQHATGEEDRIGFAISSGAYFVETNGGGVDATGGPRGDPSIGAYRANAAAARYSRSVAARLYGPHRPFGYAYGGSGGAFRTIGGLENTEGVWDGVVPYVPGSPMAIPNVFTVRMQALRLLKGEFPRIVDAMEPGGSGDIYAGLDDEQRAALLEATKMGFPPRAWFGYETMGTHGLAALYQGVLAADPGYFQDFWIVPGYLGADPPASLLRDRVRHETRIVALITNADAIRMGLPVARSAGRGAVDTSWRLRDEDANELPVGFRLAKAPPPGDLAIADLTVRSGAARGSRLQSKLIAGDVVLLESGLAGAHPDVLRKIRPGDTIDVDNANFLALQTYHRHQVPPSGYPVWDQFRDADGKPLYPQRPMLLGPLFTRGTAGTVPTGRFKGKMIVVASLLDREAYPWQADWYRSKVEENLGDALDEHFRLWFTDNALHGDSERQDDRTHSVSYLGVLHQALRDLAAWVEEGVPPPASTRYGVVDGQVRVPAAVAERMGIQPVVSLTANGAERADVSAGERVSFAGRIEAPPAAGKIVSAEWDFDGSGAFAQRAAIGKSASAVDVRASRSFPKPGTYFVTLRAALQRDGDAGSPYARVQNLARVRVVVGAEQ